MQTATDQLGISEDLMYPYLSQLRYDLINNPHTCQDVFDAIRNCIVPLINVSEKYNAIYSIDDFDICLIQAYAHNTQII